MSQSRLLRNSFLILMVAAVTGLGACSKKQQLKEEPVSVPNAADADENQGDSDSGKAMGLQTINFPFDSFVLDSAAKAKLTANVGIMKAKSSMNIQIEGHCDERGGIQYNIALGEKRANAVKKFMADMGVNAERITTISFGKERPIDNGKSEEAYARNRRANFVITSR